MRMRFWQKTYLFTLVLFLLCINIGILSLTVYTYQKNVEATETAVKAEHYYIAKNFERNYEDLNAVHFTQSSPSLLMQSYGTYYGNKGFFIAFEEAGERLYTNFQNPYTVMPDQLMHTDFDGKRHIVIASTICDGKYDFVFAKDVSDLDRDLTTMILIYAVTGLGVSLGFGVVLYFILRTLSAPLEQLRATTEVIQNGDYTVMVAETGSDEFTQLAKSFNAMLATIREQVDALEVDSRRKQMLVDNLAHELRTPLTSIQGYGEYLQKASVTEEQRIDAAGYILSESQRLQKISEILLDSAYIREHPPARRPLNMAEILADVAQKLQGKAEGAAVSLTVAPGNMVLQGNDTLLSMLCYNLTENAIKACRPGGCVHLSMTDGVVCVADNGKGMTEEQLAHITEPFYRTDQSRARAEGGAGLGLALCQQIATAHNASLGFESQVGLGTNVYVDFTSSIQVGDGLETDAPYPERER